MIPACCTDRLQPLDLSVNKSAKSFLRSEFQQWYSSDEIAKQLEDTDEIEPVDLSTSRMKCVGAQWMVRLFEYISQNPSLIVNGFLAANIAQSIDAGTPVLDDAPPHECRSECSTDDEYATDDEYSSIENEYDSDTHDV